MQLESKKGRTACVLPVFYLVAASIAIGISVAVTISVAISAIVAEDLPTELDDCGLPIRIRNRDMDVILPISAWTACNLACACVDAQAFRQACSLISHAASFGVCGNHL